MSFGQLFELIGSTRAHILPAQHAITPRTGRVAFFGGGCPAGTANDLREFGMGARNLIGARPRCRRASRDPSLADARPGLGRIRRHHIFPRSGAPWPRLGEGRASLDQRRPERPGAIEERRARQIKDELLRTIRAHRGRVVVIDLTGVPIIDSMVANQLVQTIEAARLLGAKVIVTGISQEAERMMKAVTSDPPRRDR